ncbi:hypothetical protein Tco_0913456, partial [Tanacetum coccineum]
VKFFFIVRLACWAVDVFQSFLSEQFRIGHECYTSFGVYDVRGVTLIGLLQPRHESYTSFGGASSITLSQLSFEALQKMMGHPTVQNMVYRSSGYGNSYDLSPIGLQCIGMQQEKSNSDNLLDMAEGGEFRQGLPTTLG